MADLGLVPLGPVLGVGQSLVLVVDRDLVACGRCHGPTTSGNACLGRKTAPEGVPPEAVWLSGEESRAGVFVSDTLATSNVLLPRSPGQRT